MWLNYFVNDCHFDYITKSLKETLVAQHTYYLPLTTQTKSYVLKGKELMMKTQEALHLGMPTNNAFGPLVIPTKTNRNHRKF
jgi:hypothetical protein